MWAYTYSLSIINHVNVGFTLTIRVLVQFYSVTFGEKIIFSPTRCCCCCCLVKLLHHKSSKVKPRLAFAACDSGGAGVAVSALPPVPFRGGGKSRVHDRIPVKQRWYNNHNYDDRSVHFSFSNHFHHSSQVKSDISILQNSSKSIRYKSAKNNSVCFISCSAMGRREKIFSILPTTTVVPKQTEAHYLQRVLGLMFCRSEQPVRPCVFVLTRAATYAAVG